MRGVYNKECWFTLIAFLICALLTHIFPMYFLFPELMDQTIFGFPAHYFLAIFFGWIALIPLYWIYINISEAIDREILEGSMAAAEAAEAGAAPNTDSAQGGAR